MPVFKRILLKLAGRRYDQMAAGKSQKYYFIFFMRTERAYGISSGNPIAASEDEVFRLEEVNKVLKKQQGADQKEKLYS